MLIVDFELQIGSMWKRAEDSNEVIDSYSIYYCPNALFAICDKEKNLITFAADETHLKNMLGKTKEYHTNVFEGYSFSFTYYDSSWFKKNPERIKNVFKTITKTFTTGKITNYFALYYVASEGE